MTYKIHFIIHFRVRTKLYDSGPRNYDRGSGRGTCFAWNDVRTASQILEAASVHDASLGVADLLSAELSRIADEFEQNIICLLQRGKEPVESEGREGD